MVRDIPLFDGFFLLLFGLFCVAWTYELPCQDKLPEFHYIPIVCCIRVLWLVFQPLGLGLDKALFGWNSVSLETLAPTHWKQSNNKNNNKKKKRMIWMTLGLETLAPTHWKQSNDKNNNKNKKRTIWMTLGLVMLAPTHWKQNINKNNNIIETHNEYRQPLLRRRDEGTQYRRNFVICATSDNDRRMDNPRGRHAML